MNKSTPLAKGIRTFLFLLAGSATSFVGLDLIADFKAGATIIGIAVLAALLGGVIAFLQALLTTWTGTSPVSRAIFTFLQAIVAWLLTVTITDLTLDTFADLGKGFMRILVSAVLAAVAALLTNAAEDNPEASPDSAAERQAKRPG